MGELDHNEGWVPKNWYFWTVVLEKTLESPLDSKEIKLVNPKGNQSWIFIGRTDAEPEAPILWPPDVKIRLIRKDPDAGKDWRQEDKGMTENEIFGWMASLTQWMSLSNFREMVKDRKAWHAAVHGVKKCQTWLSEWITTPGYVVVSFYEWVKSLSRVRLFATLWTVAYQAPLSMGFSRLLCPWDFPGKNTGVGCHFLLQEIFRTQGLNPGLSHCRQTLYCLSHQGSQFL